MDQIGGLLPILLFLAVIYFVMIRPQQKRQKQHKEMVGAVAVGDDIITAGGLHGRVVALSDETMDIEVTDDIVVRFQKNMLGRVLREEDEFGEQASS